MASQGPVTRVADIGSEVEAISLSDAAFPAMSCFRSFAPAKRWFPNARSGPEASRIYCICVTAVADRCFHTRSKGGLKSGARLWKGSKVPKYAEWLAGLFRLQPERTTGRYRRLPRTARRRLCRASLAHRRGDQHYSIHLGSRRHAGLKMLCIKFVAPVVIVASRTYESSHVIPQSGLFRVSSKRCAASRKYGSGGNSHAE